MSKRLTLEFIQDKFREKNYEPLFDEYKNNTQKLKYICSKGHVGKISWSHFQQKERCYICGIESTTKKQRKDFSYIKKEFKRRDYELLTKEKEYKNNHQKLNYMCPEGHMGNIMWINFRNGCGCQKCAGNVKKDFLIIQKEFEKRKYILLTKKENYKNNHQKLNYICPNKHKGNMSWINFKQGKGCLICAINNMCGENNPMWKGGKSFEPYSYEFTKRLKKMIKERDDNKCMNPDCWNNSKKLCVHHINYDKNNCNFNNLITLCFSCNSRANKNRDKWIKIYTEIIKIMGSK